MEEISNWRNVTGTVFISAVSVNILIYQSHGGYREKRTQLTINLWKLLALHGKSVNSDETLIELSKTGVACDQIFINFLKQIVEPECINSEILITFHFIVV